MARKITEIVVHCSATRPDQDVDVKWCKDIHVNQNGWSDVGYHWFIKRDGTVEPGRSEERSGAHVKGHNSNSIGVCMAGGIDGNGNSDFNFTVAQLNSLELVINNIRHRYPIAKVQGHRDYPNVSKACPCFDVGAWYGEIDPN